MEQSKSSKKKMGKCSLCPKIVEREKLKKVDVPLRKWKLCKKCYQEFKRKERTEKTSSQATKRDKS